MSATENLGLIAQRKVQMGKTTKYVSLPKVWCEAHEVDKGSILEIYLDSESRLVIQKEVESKFAEKEETETMKEESNGKGDHRAGHR